MALLSNEELPLSFLLDFFLFEPQFCLQLRHVVMEILFGLFKQAKHKKDFKMHEKWGKNERYSERRYINSRIADTQRGLTSEQIIQQRRGTTLVYTMSIELGKPTTDVNRRGNLQRTWLRRVCCRSQQSHHHDRKMGQLFE